MKLFSPWIFAGLVIMNIALLAVIWLGRPAGRPPHGQPFGMGHEGPRLQHYLESKLNFDEKQKQAYETLIHEHRRQIDSSIWRFKKPKKTYTVKVCHKMIRLSLKSKIRLRTL
jgi:Spy/CpxP family protein refolding chaperone